jgi:hypothetical protein
MTCLPVNSGWRFQIVLMRIRAAVFRSSRHPICCWAGLRRAAASRQVRKKAQARIMHIECSGFSIFTTCCPVQSGCDFQMASTRA